MDDLCTKRPGKQTKLESKEKQIDPISLNIRLENTTEVIDPELHNIDLSFATIRSRQAEQIRLCEMTLNLL